LSFLYSIGEDSREVEESFRFKSDLLSRSWRLLCSKAYLDEVRSGMVILEDAMSSLLLRLFSIVEVERARLSVREC